MTPLEKSARLFAHDWMESNPGATGLYRAALSHLDAALIDFALKECRGNQSKAARLLGVNRNTFRKKMRVAKSAPHWQSLSSVTTLAPYIT